MNKFLVNVCFSTYVEIEIEAGNEDEAMNMAAKKVQGAISTQYGKSYDSQLLNNCEFVGCEVSEIN